MDALEKLVWDADDAVGVLGRGEDYVLVPLDGQGPIPQEAIDDANRRGFRFCGVLAIMNGQAAAKCEADPDAVGVMMLAAIGFAQQAAEKLKAKPKDEGAEWLRRLWELPDTRD